MGVIKKSSISNPISESIEDVLENIEQVEQEQVPEVRRPRKIKQRSSRPHAIGDIINTNAKSGKKKKRVDNSNYLLSLAETDDLQDLDINDFIPETVSVFSQMFLQKDKLEMWNEFINCTEDNEGWYLKNVGESSCKRQVFDDCVDICADMRSEHPAYIAAKCFRRIDNGLRIMLKKQHIPLGALQHLERELVTFFVNRPSSVYHCRIPSSFERLMVHALAQYLDLISLSYDRSGSRWTRVRNRRADFCLPPVLLSALLEDRRAGLGSL